MRKYFLTIIICIVGIPVLAQVSENSELFIQLKKCDSLVFEEGFNKCNFESLDKVIHKDLEFLHDQGGIQNKEAFFKAMKQNICSTPDAKPIRKLVEGSLQAFPMKNNGVLYGAILMGSHEFFIASPGKPLRITGVAKFIGTWILENNAWKLKHVLSFDHQPATGHS